jgi:hypothetical protein
MQYINLTTYHLLVETKNIGEYIVKLNELLTPNDFEKVVDYIYLLSANPYNNINDIFTPKQGCARVYYKPNNPQFAQQGGVSSSTRILKLNVDTITKNAYNTNKNQFKEKTQTSCNPATFIGNPFFFNGQKQNKLICKSNNAGLQYHTYDSVYDV